MFNTKEYILMNQTVVGLMDFYYRDINTMEVIGLILFD